MDNDKLKKKPATPAAKKSGLLDYFKGIRLEMKKVVWPTKKELGSYTVAVLFFCAFFALCFWLMDLDVLKALKAILDITL